MACTGHVGSGFCTGHTNAASCGGHVGTGAQGSNYILPWTPSWTGGDILAGETIELANELNELAAHLNTEATRRSLATASLTFASTIDQTEIRLLRNHHNTVCAKTSVSPYSDTQIVTGATINANTMEAMRDNLNARAAICVCNCAYACTCQCNYGCTCNCNYGCTCNCNYPCVCNCNYSDEDLKENIIYL